MVEERNVARKGVVQMVFTKSKDAKNVRRRQRNKEVNELLGDSRRTEERKSKNVIVGTMVACRHVQTR